MTLRKITWLLAAPVLLLASGLSAWSWLLHSESGARWLLGRLDSSIQASVTASTIEGNLGSGLWLGGFKFDDGGTRIDVEQLSIAVDIDLLPPAIDLQALQAESAVVRILQPSSQESDLEKTIQGLSLPVPVNFEDITVYGLEYIDIGEEDALVIHSLEFAGSLHKQLVVERGSISLPGNDLALSGQLGLAAPHPLSLEFRAGGDFTLQGSMNGSLESAEVDLDSQYPQLRIKGTVGRLLHTAEWDLDISSPLIQWPLDGQEPVTRLTGAAVHSTGQWPRFDMDLEGDLELQGVEPSRLKLVGEGDSNAFEARHLSLAGPELSLSASGSFSWEDGLHLALNAALERLEPGKWLDDWPQNHPVSGELALEWGGEDLTVSGFSLGVAHTSFSAEGEGVIDLRSGIVDGQLSWSDLSWPPGSPAPLVESQSGSFLVSGRPENWKLDGKLAVQAGEFPEGQVRMSGAGDLESLSVTVHEGMILGGTLSGDIGWNWTASQPFNAKLALEKIGITPLVPQYPGVLNAQLTASGELEPFRLGADLQQLDGVVRGQPISANGGFHLEHGLIYADGLNLRSGASTLYLNGGLYESDGIDFSANIESLALFSSEASGELAAEGSISLHPESPKFSATLSGRQVAFGTVRIAQIETRERSGTGKEAGPGVVMTGLEIEQRPIESLSVRFDGEQPLQGIAVHALVNGTDISLELNGSVNDWNQPLASGWSGSLSGFRLDHEGDFYLALDHAAALEWTPSRFGLEEACFTGTREARMCLGSSWSSQGELNIVTNLVAIPVGLLEPFIDEEVEFTQLLSGTFNWSKTAAGERKGGARIDISAGRIQADEGDEVLLETGPGLFGFELAGGQLRQGDLDFSIPGSGTIDFDFSIPNLGLGRESPIQGTARIDLKDIGAVALIFPIFDTIDGVLNLDLGLSGTLSDPAFKGTVELENGHLENRASGFSFSAINISGAVSELDRSELEGSFRAGDGEGKISASIHFEDILAPVIDLALEGESLTVIDVPDLKVIANPDIDLSWRDKILEINGRLLIPSARISPSELPQNSISQSEDIVIVAGELPGAEQDLKRGKAISVRGNLELELGEEITIELDLAKARASGSAQFNWQDDLIPMAEGAFDVTGEIQAFGQFLRVTRGRISFPGIPADNPHLNIRAEREIFGNSQIRRAGLMVAGTFRRPLIEAYTVPMTNKHRAQTLLVTGSDFNYEQGVGALDVGMYVLPRLYISYGIGVFEDGNVLKARYDLGRGFGIKATSGQRETGLDISYTVER